MDLADGMGVALYQRFTMAEAAEFLRCTVDDLFGLIQTQKINCIQITESVTEFFGYHLLRYILRSTSQIEFKASDGSTTDTHILRAPEVCQKTSLSRTTIWRMERAGKFPKRVSLGQNAVGWRSDEIEDWIRSRKP